MYTVSRLAQLSGVTPRTSHHYDAIGLLPPTRIGENGYRYYGEKAVLALQQILFCRELGMSLRVIKKLISSPAYSYCTLLEEHKAALHSRIGRLEQLIATIDKTLARQRGVLTMSDESLFEGLNPQEKGYAVEAMERWDQQVVKESLRRYRKLSREEQDQMRQDGEKMNREWALLIGTDPAGPEPQKMVDAWRKGIEFFWMPSLDMLEGLAQMYIEDPRFKATYDRIDERLAEYILACVRAYVSEQR